MREPWKDRRKQLEDLFAPPALPLVGLVPVTEDAATLYVMPSGMLRQPAARALVD